MTDIAALAASIRARLGALADEPTRRKYERLVPGAKVMGVAVPSLRTLATTLKKETPALSLADACDLMGLLCAERTREEMLVGIFLLGRFGRSVRTVPWAKVEAWLPSLDNWETCDQLASTVAAAIVTAEPALVGRLVELTGSTSRWIRRFAVATSADLTHAGRGMTEAVFQVCTPLLQDEDAMVQKAIGWAIREASKADEDAAFAYLRRVRPSMRPRTVREAAEKLSEARRQALAE